MEQQPPSRHAAYRKRKREGQPVGKRRSVAELARLAALPPEQLSYAEKEALRNQRRKANKRQPAQEAVSTLVPSPPPPSRAASAAPPATAAAAAMLSLSPEVASIPMHSPSLAFGTQDLEDILAFDPAAVAAPPPAPSPPSAAAAAASVLPAALSPAAAQPSPTPSQVFDTPFDAFAPLQQLPSQPPVIAPAAVPASPLLSSAAAAFAMSSASKLRQTILSSRRARLPAAPYEVRRHHESKIPHEPGRNYYKVQFVEDPSVAAALTPPWKEAADMYAANMMQRTGFRNNSEDWMKRLQEKVFYFARYGMEQAKCSAVREDDYSHSKVCQDRGGMFLPADFMGSGLVQFAHFRQYAAHGQRSSKRDTPEADGATLIQRMLNGESPIQFYEWMMRVGQFRYTMCHKNESDHHAKSRKRK